MVTVTAAVLVALTASQEGDHALVATLLGAALAPAEALDLALG